MSAHLEAAIPGFDMAWFLEQLEAREGELDAEVRNSASQAASQAAAQSRADHGMEAGTAISSILLLWMPAKR